MNNAHTAVVAAFETARARIRDGEARGLSERTMNKRYREFFAAEDALKALDGWR